MKRLFNDTEAYTNEALELSREMDKCIQPIINRWAEMGYSARDIEAVCLDSVAVACAAKRIMKERKKNDD